jgi:tetratricopeptide (TPR) repeat protein
MTPLDHAIALLNGGNYPAAQDIAVAALLPLFNVAGAAAYGRGAGGEAEQFWGMALALDPHNSDANNNLGLLFAETGRHERAEQAYRRALAVRADYPEAWNNLGTLLSRLGRKDEAEAALRRALELNPAYFAACNNLGDLLRGLDRLDEAECLLRRAIALCPDCDTPYLNLGDLLRRQNRGAAAEAAYRTLLELRPGHVQGHMELGILLTKAGRHAEAEVCFRRVIALEPGHADAHDSLGQVLTFLHRFEEAEAVYRRVLPWAPDSADIRANFAYVLLTLGKFEEAWPFHESRYDPARWRPVRFSPPPPFPRWQGQDLKGRSLLIWSEQGYGDEIQFCRFVPELKARGAARIGLFCKAPLAPLFETLASLDAVYPMLDTPGYSEVYDYWTPPLSIPLHYGLSLANIPAKLPYLKARPERLRHWRDRLPAGRPRIGLVWKGSADHYNDAFRSLPALDLLAPLWSVPGLNFVSLQKGAGEDEARRPPAAQPLLHLGSDVRDFADTAALVEQLDLVIAVDSAIVHVAGALAKPCWVLLPYINADWRWLRERDDSPWYPGVLRLFRQGPGEAWGAVIERVAGALRDWAAR